MGNQSFFRPAGTLSSNMTEYETYQDKYQVQSQFIKVSQVGQSDIIFVI